jgi:2-oxoisovalerate ferredoxin oxidoreductase beta subunit
VFFVNNTVYGMTGGQMAPTTLIGEKTVTSPEGRKASEVGYPLHMAELISQLKAPVYVARVSFSTMAKLRQARQSIRKALEIQRDGKGYAFVEVLMACPTNQKMNVEEATRFVAEQMEAEFPLGVFRDEIATAQPIVRSQSDYRKETLDHLLNLDTDRSPDATPDPAAPTFRLKMAGFGGQGGVEHGADPGAGGLRGRQICFVVSLLRPRKARGHRQLRGGGVRASHRVAGGLCGGCAGGPEPALAREVHGRGEARRTSALPTPPSGEVQAPEGVRAIAVPVVDLAREGGNSVALNTAMVGVVAGLGGLGLPDELYLQAISVHFEGREKVVRQNQEIFPPGPAVGREPPGVGPGRRFRAPRGPAQLLPNDFLAFSGACPHNSDPISNDRMEPVWTRTNPIPKRLRRRRRRTTMPRSFRSGWRSMAGRP